MTSAALRIGWACALLVGLGAAGGAEAEPHPRLLLSSADVSAYREGQPQVRSSARSWPRRRSA